MHCQEGTVLLPAPRRWWCTAVRALKSRCKICGLLCCSSSLISCADTCWPHIVPKCRRSSSVAIGPKCGSSLHWPGVSFVPAACCCFACRHVYFLPRQTVSFHSFIHSFIQSVIQSSAPFAFSRSLFFPIFYLTWIVFIRDTLIFIIGTTNGPFYISLFFVATVPMRSRKKRRNEEWASSDVRNILPIDTVVCLFVVQINFHNDSVFIARLVSSTATCQPSTCHRHRGFTQWWMTSVHSSVSNLLPLLPLLSPLLLYPLHKCLLSTAWHLHIVSLQSN